MNEFVPGQRVISDTEPELGLGTITSVEHRTLAVEFAASGENRVYTRQQPPLHRVRFGVGDHVQNRQGATIQIEAVQEQQGLLIYVGKTEDGTVCDLPEAELNDLTQLSKPSDRLLSGQLDNETWYRLRYESREYLHHLLPSPIYGLSGARVSLLPHQLFIAHEVANRNAPRVLLADEVGLGKTIEAGLILHQQVLRERVKRALLIVPEPLLHQWLVEMLRRFNLRFSLFNEDRCAAHVEDDGNPFLSEQLVLCSLDFFIQHPEWMTQALAAGWDMLVVDEAHHLQWQPQQPSPEYEFVEQLAQQTPSVLLLTATPEQLGAAGHFARLRLLDPHRFHDLQAFLAEEEQYQPIAQAAAELLDATTLSSATINTLHKVFHDTSESRALLDELVGAKCDTDKQEHIRETLLHQLVDRHGTGRMLFRNTRKAVKGFPLREAHGYALAPPPEYNQIHTVLATAEAQTQFAANFGVSFQQLSLTPEIIYQTLSALDLEAMQNALNWWQCDPRVSWLASKLRELKKHKTLVICASAQTALDLEAVLRQREGMRVGVFHEDLKIIERDRAAAWFADMEAGAQALICSEIGSEGRNFQFAHHLVLFDLPLNPDLLEQRIGRLDRIGQRHTIQIHIPYLANTAQEIMYRWYQEGMQAFTHTCPAGPGVYEQIANELLPLLAKPQLTTPEIDTLVTHTQPIYYSINERLQAGRDRLLELNSYRQTEAEQIRQLILQQDTDKHIVDYLSRLCDAFGVEFEGHSEHSYIIHPGDHMQVHHFPELKDEGVTVTFDRETALVHEDRLFLSWEHPMLTGGMDLLLGSERGNAALSVCKLPGLKTGEMLLEVMYNVECVAPAYLQVERFLPPSVVRLLINSRGEDLSEKYTIEQLQGLPVDLGKQTITQIISTQQEYLRRMLNLAEKQSATLLPTLVTTANNKIETELAEELQRLTELQRVNPNVREDEIESLREQMQLLHRYMQTARLHQDAVRLIIAA
jgi:ATP-dependent helicase HepA